MKLKDISTSWKEFKESTRIPNLKNPLISEKNIFCCQKESTS